MGVVGFDLATAFAWASVDRGNSAATFTLAASVTGLAVVQVRERVVVLVGAFIAGCGIFLLALRDAHGSAVVGGLVIGVLAGPSPHRASFPPPQPAPRVWMPGERWYYSSVTTRDRHSRHRAVRDAATAQVAVTADQDAVRAAKVTAVLIKRCRTVLTERCRYITK